MSRCSLLLAAASLALSHAAEPAVKPGDLARIAPTPPEKAISTFKLRPGVKIELVAAEPLVVDPIAISFDENNQLFVVEMRDYSERAHERLGRIRLLKDTNNDGRMDESFIFAEDLAWPTGVIAYGGGVFVIATPDILFLKDTDGDHRADVRRVVLTGLGVHGQPLNVQQLANSLAWSLDNRIHVATGGNGGLIKRPNDSAEPLNVRVHDFSFDPHTFETRLETGGGQYGASFDDWGRKFLCNNSSHIRQVIYEQRDIPPSAQMSLGAPVVAIANDGPAAPVFRASQEEPWRVLRTQWRVAGLVPGPIEGGGRASGYFTSATGLAVYRGQALGAAFEGDVFVADCGSNLIHRKKLRPAGVEFAAERADDEKTSEFLASTDTWFRPVQLANGPDGALYVVDMYREIIEHPWSIPKVIKDNVDLNSGNTMGRIYRVTAVNTPEIKLVNLSKSSTRELAAHLGDPNGWTRDTAARVLYERQDRSAAEALKEVPLEPVARIHRLGVLAGLKALRPNDILVGLRDQDARVREHALRMLAGVTWSAAEQVELAAALERLAQDPVARVPHELLLAVTRKPLLEFWPVVTRALAQSDDSWIRNAGIAAIHSILQQHTPELSGPPYTPWLFQEYLRALGANGSKEQVETAKTVMIKLTATERDLALSGLAALLSHKQTRDNIASQLASARLYQKLLQDSVEMLAAEEPADLAVLRNAVAIVATAKAERAVPSLAGALRSRIPAPVQEAAIQELLAKDRNRGAELILQRWPQLTPTLRSVALDRFIAVPDLHPKLEKALAEGAIHVSEFTASNREALRKQQAPSAASIVSKYLKPADGALSRQQVVQKFTPALALKGDPEKGKGTFHQRRAACHKYKGEGQEVGPDLQSVKSNGSEYLLVHFIDPNRELSSRFIAYDLELRSGEAHTGIIVDENSDSLSIRDASGRTHKFAREFVHNLNATGKSLMPEGLEEGLSSEDVADLLAYLRN
ncbi:MAG TPA: PVC-type heme-binding CxxCH protein [Methylomirabilota bacterium]|nr:PVC-type heme-binding CxxCH protein [Methylomirabilota bacterium]